MAEFNCLASSGAIIYSPEGNYGTDGSGGGFGGSGGMGGGGSVWSDSEQLIWISVNDAPKYPVWLQPGWNEVHFWIPFIFPDDEWIEAPIIIEAPGYILIPAGFEINIKTSEDAPVRTGNPKMTDKLKFVDVYDIEIQEVPVPVDLDGLFEDIIFEGIHAIDIINATLMAEQSLIENLNVEDVYNVEIEEVPVPVDLDGIFEDIIFEDMHAIDIINAKLMAEQSLIENLNLEDISSVEIESEPFSGEFDKIEEISIEDINSTTLVNTTIANNNTTEDVGFTDFVDIEK